jgi:hypothetical protein
MIQSDVAFSVGNFNLCFSQWSPLKAQIRVIASSTVLSTDH